jgi:hypothetical protein
LRLGDGRVVAVQPRRRGAVRCVTTLRPTDGAEFEECREVDFVGLRLGARDGETARTVLPETGFVLSVIAPSPQVVFVASYTLTSTLVLRSSLELP